MNRETQNVLLLLVGGAVLKTALDGTYLRYVQQSMQPLLLAGGALTVLLALAAIVRDIRQSGHSHDEPGGAVYWMLLIPAAVMLFVVPPALGASSVGVSSKQQAPTAAPANFDALPPGEAPELSLMEFVQRASSGKSVDGRTVTLTGYLLENDDKDPAKGWDLARMVITCCAADAGTVRVHLETAPADVKRGHWYAVRAEVVPGTATESSGYTPTVKLSSATPISEPAVPYER